MPRPLTTWDIFLIDSGMTVEEDEAFLDWLEGTHRLSAYNLSQEELDDLFEEWNGEKMRKLGTASKRKEAKMPIQDEKVTSIDAGFDDISGLFIKVNGRKFYITLTTAFAFGNLLIRYSRDRRVNAIDERFTQLRMLGEMRKPCIIKIDKTPQAYQEKENDL